MTEVIMLILSCSLALFLFIWLAFGRKVTSKAATLFMDICLLALCIAALICGLTLRQEKYESLQKENTRENTQENSMQTNSIQQESIQGNRIGT